MRRLDVAWRFGRVGPGTCGPEAGGKAEHAEGCARGLSRVRWCRPCFREPCRNRRGLDRRLLRQGHCEEATGAGRRLTIHDAVGGGDVSSSPPAPPSFTYPLVQLSGRLQADVARPWFRENS